jgi:hypothetical protein
MRPVFKPVPPAQDLRPSGGKTLDELIQEALMNTIGRYCSYCEMPLHLGDFIEIKTSRQAGIGGNVLWDDLMLSCDYCHLYKRIEREELGNHDAAGPDIDIDDPQPVPRTFPINPGDYLWPDVDATFSLTNASPFIYELRTVTVRIGSAQPQNQNLAIVRANPNADAETQRKAQNTINLYQLNTPYYDAHNDTLVMPQEAYNAVVDPRVMFRTKAWNEAYRCTQQYLQAVQYFQDSPLLSDALMVTYTDLAQSMGFWSVWMTVFFNELHPTQTAMEQLFVQTDFAGDYMIYGYQLSKGFVQEDGGGGDGGDGGARPGQKRKRQHRPGPSKRRALAAALKLLPGTAATRIEYP